MPKRKITKKEFKQKYKPWVTRGILTSIRRKYKLLTKFIRTKTQSRKQVIHNEYKTLRNQIIDLTQKSKQFFFIKITLMKTILISEKYGRESKKSLTLMQKIILVVCVLWKMMTL